MAKKRARAIDYSRGKDTKRALYRELIAATRATQAALHEVSGRLANTAGIAAGRWRAEVSHYLPLIERILVQSERRVLAGLPVPAGDKLVSLFEPHADIVLKGGREVQYGHKLNLATGKSGLILDVVVEAGNPADAERFLPMLDRHIARYGVPPRQTAADGGYASLGNLQQAKARGVEDVAFHKKRGIAIDVNLLLILVNSVEKGRPSDGHKKSRLGGCTPVWAGCCIPTHLLRIVANRQAIRLPHRNTNKYIATFHIKLLELIITLSGFTGCG